MPRTANSTRPDVICFVCGRTYKGRPRPAGPNKGELIPFVHAVEGQGLKNGGFQCPGVRLAATLVNES